MAAQTSNAWGESLWDYSIRVYRIKGVERALLALQDEYRANVDIVLWCCWLQAEAICLSREALNDALMSIDTVNQASLTKLREVRRFIKAAESFTEEQARDISGQILSVELRIEKVLIYELQDLTCRFLDGMQDQHKPLTLGYYLDSIMIPGADQIARKIAVTCLCA